MYNYKHTFIHVHTGPTSYPRDLKQIRSDYKEITFDWKEFECEKRNGILLGYEVMLYYNDETRTERVTHTKTTYSILRRLNSMVPFPNSISVAAINEIGVGVHSPPVKLNLIGKE